MYCEYWTDDPLFRQILPVYGEPRVIVYEEESYDG